VNFRFSKDETVFRDEVREFLEDYRDLDGFFGQDQKWDAVKKLFGAMGERGWLALAWPKEHGGLERGPAYEYILWDEVAYARAARNPLSAGIVARSIIRYGSEEQKQRWLPPIASGEMHFSLGYSEPEAGSDLGSLRVRAEPTGDGHYEVSGQKCWQSYAGRMDYLWLLARTGTQESRGRGTSLFIADLESPGIQVSPLPTMDDHQLYEIHLDRARIPAENRVGPENGAWGIMGEALADERHIQFPPGRVRRDLEEMLRWLRDAGLDQDAVVRHRMADLAVQVREVEMHGLIVLDAMQKGLPADVKAAANKVVHTVVSQKIARAVMDFGGPEAVVHGSRPELLWCQTMWETIGGGTSEVMRGVVAKAGLGLTGRR
jgi:alkylation response protein AidB-like acyl-CoA dehydrogenase